MLHYTAWGKHTGISDQRRLQIEQAGVANLGKAPVDRSPNASVFGSKGCFGRFELRHTPQIESNCTNLIENSQMSVS